jgi:hypothetical protein
VRRSGSVWAGLLALLLAMGAMAPALAQDEALVRVVPSSDTVKVGADALQVDVVVDNVQNLAAFEFTLQFDPSVVELAPEEADQVENECGDFLGSTGREVHPLGTSTTDNSLTVRCLTLGPPVSAGGSEGPSGSGTLATLWLHPLAQGESPLTLDDVKLIAAEWDEEERPIVIPSATQDSAVIVTTGGGFRWQLWGPVIGVGALVLAAVAGGLLWLRPFARRP